MRWKWRLGLLTIAIVEVPVLLWAAVQLDAPPETILGLAVAVTGFLLGLLALRPTLFGLAGVWLLGFAGGAWYLLRYVHPVLALTFSGILSSLGCAVASPLFARSFRLLVRRSL